MLGRVLVCGVCCFSDSLDGFGSFGFLAIEGRYSGDWSFERLGCFAGVYGRIGGTFDTVSEFGDFLGFGVGV